MKSVFLVLSLPALLAIGEAARYHVHNRSNGTLVSSGDEREYLLHVPRSYDGTKPVALVITLPGAGGWPALMRDISGWNALADREGFIVVYPSGIKGAGPRIWHVQPGTRLPRDVRFITDLIDKLRSQYNIDPQRVYANGLSNGGGMSFALSCTVPDRIAAVGLVSSAQTLPSRWCRDGKPVPVIAIHGTDDPVTPYNGGASWMSVREFPNIPEFMADWARRNRCSGDPLETKAAPDATVRTYRNCANDAAVVFYTMHGGGHTWPGGYDLPEWFMGKTPTSVNANEVMWEFFQRHPARLRAGDSQSQLRLPSSDASPRR